MSEGRDRVEAALARMPYASFLGASLAQDGDGERFLLTYKDSLIGNTWIPALHGGALGAFMEIAARAALAGKAEIASARLPATVGVTVEYLRPGRPIDTFADVTIKRLGRRIANVHVEAWQEDPSTPVTLLQGRFLLAG